MAEIRLPCRIYVTTCARNGADARGSTCSEQDGACDGADA